MGRRRGRNRRATRRECSLTDLGAVITWCDRAGNGSGPLSGMRIGVKDNIDVAGVVSTCGSRFFEGQVASEDSEVVSRLLGAGASVVAKLNMAEFAVGVTSQNTAGPVPRNPWDLSRVPGGSSGGSGSAVAAGLVDASLGTDTGGSVRLPASACGVTGLRPTWGAISNEGVFPVSEDFDTVGPMARTVGDVARLFSVLSRATDLGGVARRIGVPRVFVTDDIDPAIADAISAAPRELASLGYELVPVDVPGAGTAQEIVYTLIYYDLARRHRARLEQSPELFQPATLQRISLGLSISENQRLDAVAGRKEFRAGLAGLFSEVDVVLTPTMPVDVPLIDGGADVVEQSRRMGQLTYPWSLHDGPTLALPIGFHPSSGMPIGAQLTASAHREAMLFEIGSRYQAAAPHEQVPPTLV